MAVALMAVVGVLITLTPAAHALAVTTTISLDGGVRAVAIAPDGSRVYAADRTIWSTASVAVIDTGTNRVTDKIPLGYDRVPIDMAVTPDGSRAYVLTEFGGGSNRGGPEVSVIDTSTKAVTATFPVSKSPARIAIAPDGQRVYITHHDGRTVYDPGMVSVIDTTTNAVTATVRVSQYPVGVTVTPDGSRVYVTNRGVDGIVEYGETVSVIDTVTNTVTATVKVGKQPYAVAITPNGAHAYVANRLSGTVSVIDTATNAVAATIEVGGRPSAVAISPTGHRAYVADASGSVSVIDTATNAVVATRAVADYLADTIVITPDGTHAYVAHDLVSVIALQHAVLTGTPPAGAVGQPYSYNFNLTADPAATVAVTAGSLPAGLTLSTAGVLSGIPTVGGRFEFTVTATNGVGADAVLPVVLEVNQAAAVAGTLPGGVVGQSYNHTFTLTGYPAAKVAVTAGALPAGLTLSTAGVLSGIPTVGGRFEFTVTATNGVGADAVLPVVLEVNQAPAVSGTPPGGAVGQRYRFDFGLAGDPAPTVVVTAGTLPAGLTLSTAGVLSGIPTAGGRFEFTVTATNGVGADARLPVVLEIDRSAMLYGTPPAGIVGEPYRHAFTLVGYPHPAVLITGGTLPAGLALSAEGVLTGTPAVSGRFGFTVTASNGIGPDSIMPVVLEIADRTSTGSLGSMGS
ncbi:putative Ig domain-containing protein [Prescottella equi]